jgi:hypothetical protein
MVDYERKLIYIHVPKTGGSAIESALIHKDLGNHDYKGQRNDTIKTNNLKRYFPPKGNPHASLRDTLLGVDDIEEFTIFTTVRNPWDRYASFYRYHKRLYKFNSTLKQYNSNQGKAFYKYTLSSMIHLDNVIYLRQENLQEDFSNMLSNLGLKDVELPLVNTTKKTDYKLLLDGNDGIIEQIKKASEKEINLFSYKY